MYDLKDDIDKISKIMTDIKDGKISRNKNFYTLARIEDYQRFRRAKLLISLVEAFSS